MQKVRFLFLGVTYVIQDFVLDISWILPKGELNFLFMQWHIFKVRTIMSKQLQKILLPFVIYKTKSSLVFWGFLQCSRYLCAIFILDDRHFSHVDQNQMRKAFFLNILVKRISVSDVLQLGSVSRRPSNSPYPKHSWLNWKNLELIDGEGRVM